MRLDVGRATNAVQAFARKLRLAPEAACQGVLEVANANMEEAIRVISVERGYDPREFVLLSFGGAGGMHAADLARRLSIPEVLIPAHPGILSAFGMAISDYLQEYAQTVLVPATEFTPERAAAAFGELEERGRQAMLDEGVAPAEVQISRFLDMCYTGQSFELMVPFGPGFIDEFHRRHEGRYGYQNSARPTQVVNVRIRVVGPSETVYRLQRTPEHRGEARQAQIDSMRMFVDEQWQAAPVYDRQRLQAGDRFHGPALVTEYSATTVIPADFAARVDGQHNLILRADSAR
jgi:N-methylhydantoinase A